MAAREQKKAAGTDPLAWWREARFGMFIHWGLYAVPAGEWQGKPIPSLGEWIMRNAQIPIAEYEQLAKQFNPVKFNAEEWVNIAKGAGMKYLVITAKHHDGFAMFHSPSNPYNIVDATPYGKDVMKDLAEACRKAGIRLCFYYSQAQDWHAPGGAGHWEASGGDPWYRQSAEPEAFARYLEEKVKPQVTELLTQYGPIGLIWFDTPVIITREQSLALKELVHSLQPDCLVSGRVGHDVGDYGSLGDNQIPCGPVAGEWETPATLNDTWGYKKDDHNWKSVKDLLYLLVDLTSKGVNYLLNVGPTGEGVIPEASVERLREIGAWMDVNGEAIYGTQPNPYPYEFPWGRITVKENKLFLLFYSWPRQITLPGLRNHVRGAYLLADPETAPEVKQRYDAALDQHFLDLSLPQAQPDPLVSVAVLEFDGALDVDTSLFQQPGGGITLPAYLAERLPADAAGMTVSRSGVLSGWRDEASWVQWRFKAAAPGEFTVKVVLGTHRGARESTKGHQVSVSVNGQTVSGMLTNEEQVESPRAQYFPEYATPLGKIYLDKPGTYEITLKADAIKKDAPDGLTIAAVELAP